MDIKGVFLLPLVVQIQLTLDIHGTTITFNLFLALAAYIIMG